MKELYLSPFPWIFGFLAIAAASSTISYWWYLARKNDTDASLKHEMIARGFTPEQIVQVINAAKPEEESDDEECEEA